MPQKRQGNRRQRREEQHQEEEERAQKWQKKGKEPAAVSVSGPAAVKETLSEGDDVMARMGLPVSFGSSQKKKRGQAESLSAAHTRRKHPAADSKPKHIELNL